MGCGTHADEGGDTDPQETDLKEGEARQIMERIDLILKQLPQAIRQAHERIIGERQLKNGEKMLSLYEGHAAVYVRGKAGAEVEFGNQLLLGESESGVINALSSSCANALSSSCASGLGTGERQSACGHENVEPEFRAVETDRRGSTDPAGVRRPGIRQQGEP